MSLMLSLLNSFMFSFALWMQILDTDVRFTVSGQWLPSLLLAHYEQHLPHVCQTWLPWRQWTKSHCQDWYKHVSCNGQEKILPSFQLSSMGFQDFGVVEPSSRWFPLWNLPNCWFGLSYSFCFWVIPCQLSKIRRGHLTSSESLEKL